MTDGRSPTPEDPLLARALELRADVERFQGRFGNIVGEGGDACLTFKWEELERQLVDLAPSDLQAELVHRLVARTKTYAALKPGEMVLREIISIAALILDESSLEVRPAAP
ncbi:MAG TPA: hypothetical protein VJS38_01390 [Phenylobacterium sp.]|uniref:hypothetical protein n=1 Tax=Phenylobacterium sp. TaxID=1871053 RepID=UPI002B459F54|nr:hypothetical protein [Phenylobacterium sp.]HKR86804.1 hypothetical protein [Phenylobacterium sp.]